MDQNEAINKVREYRRLLMNHFPLGKVFIFGSYANNSYRQDSDIDVAIVVKQIKGDFFSVNPLLWKLRREVDDRIEPILIDEAHDESGFLGEILKHGIEVI